MANKFYYHVTTYDVAKRIIDCGYVDPEFTQGRRKVSWLVSRTKASWAMAHVMQRHEVTLQELAVLTVSFYGPPLVKSNRRGVYATKIKLPATEMISAAMWLQREERYIKIPDRRRPGWYHEAD
jgi:hypothetical protein